MMISLECGNARRAYAPGPYNDRSGRLLGRFCRDPGDITLTRRGRSQGMRRHCSTPRGLSAIYSPKLPCSGTLETSRDSVKTDEEPHMALPLPEPTEPVHDATFEQLKTEVLEAVKQVQNGEWVSEEEALETFGIDPGTGN